MSTPQPPPGGQGQAPAPKRRDGLVAGLTFKQIVLLLALLYGILLLLFNLDDVDISFVFASAEAPLFIVLLLSLVIGFVAGWLWDDIRARRKGKKSP